MNKIEMNSSEQERMVLWYVDELLQFIEGKDKTLNDALTESMLQYEEDDYCQMVYKTIAAIHDKGYIEGNIHIEYDYDYSNVETQDDLVQTDMVAYDMCLFENVKVTEEGRKVLETDKRILEIKHSLKKTKAFVIEEGKKNLPLIIIETIKLIGKLQSLVLIIAIMFLMGSSMTSFAAPEAMPDGILFDAEYYAEKNLDVVAAVGTDTNALYQHYKSHGADEGRAAYDTASLNISNTEQVQSQEVAIETKNADKKLLKKKTFRMGNGGLDGTNVYEYDNQGNMAKETSYNNQGQITRETLYNYDNRGNMIKEWCPGVLNATVNSYDIQDNLIRQESYDRNGVNCWDEKFTYDNQGNLIEYLCLHYGNFTKKHIYSYDNQGNLIEDQCYAGIYESLMSRYLYLYDTQGNLIKKEYETDGIVRNCYIYNYDNSGNVTEEQYISNERLVHDIFYTYDYDAQGNLVRKDEYKYTSSDIDPNIKLSEQQSYYYDTDGDIVREDLFVVPDFHSEEGLKLRSYILYEY